MHACTNTSLWMCQEEFQVWLRSGCTCKNCGNIIASHSEGLPSAESVVEELVEIEEEELIYDDELCVGYGEEYMECEMNEEETLVFETLNLKICSPFYFIKFTCNQ